MESSRDFVEKRFTVFIQPLKVDGQIQGIHKIVEDGWYAVHVLQQTSAATRVLQAEALHMHAGRIEHCVINVVKTDAEEEVAKLSEVSKVVARLVKS
jgi:DNA-binding FrmR family transcriptional regulator